MSFDWRSIVKSVAPMLGTALGGPLGGIAGAALAKAMGGDPTKATTDDLAKLVQNVTPEQLLAIKAAEQAFQIQMRELDINSVKDLEQIAADDRASARNLQIQTKDATPQILAYAALTVWASMNGFLLYMAFRGLSLPTDMSPIIMRVLGTMDALMGMAFAFFFGTTANSGKKDQMIYNSTPTDGSK